MWVCFWSLLQNRNWQKILKFMHDSRSIRKADSLHCRIAIVFLLYSDNFLISIVDNKFNWKHSQEAQGMLKQLYRKESSNLAIPVPDYLILFPPPLEQCFLFSRPGSICSSLEHARLLRWKSFSPTRVSDQVVPHPAETNGFKCRKK